MIIICIILQLACQVSILELDNNTYYYYNYNGVECPNTNDFDKSLFFSKFYQLVTVPALLYACFTYPTSLV